MPVNPIRFLFMVQGEGRGHMMQAIALQDILLNAGHEVCAVMVGKSRRREIPPFFYQKIKSTVYTYQSPNFVMKGDGKSIDIPSTISYNLKNNKVFFKSLAQINAKVKEYRPGVILNFYELLTGIYYFLYRPKITQVAIGHQFLLQHPRFKGPEGKLIDRFMLDANTVITSLGAVKKLALSFSKMDDREKKKLKVVPPLLRDEVFKLKPVTENFFLVYLLNEGYSDEIIAWHKANPDTRLHCFWDKKDVEDEYQFSTNLTFHKLNDKKFLDLMSRCKGYVSTAGFESVCEAMYLGKPVMMVPVRNHIEQECNAADAVRAGAGIAASGFNLNPFLEYLPSHDTDPEVFRQWAKGAGEIFLQEISGMVKGNMENSRGKPLPY